MNYILFDDEIHQNLLPLTFTRPVADIRVGILTIREKWEKMLDSGTSTKTLDYLSKKFPCEFTIDLDNVWINGSFCPNALLVKEIKNLKPGKALYSDEILVAVNTGDEKDFLNLLEQYTRIDSLSKTVRIEEVWHIFSMNGEAIRSDFELLTKGRKSANWSSTNQMINPSNIFIEAGVKMECTIINASEGPVYIGEGSEIMEGSIVRGPFALCKQSVLKLGTKIYGPTTIGPYSKVGGEVNNSVIFGYSNKAHDGFLGNSVLGEWCNIGADSNNSNLKNNYAEVRLWNYAKERFVSTGLTFCGLVMGDHSKCGINTMFNTGTVIGVNANVFGSGFPRNFIPSFSWGGAAGFSTYKLKDALDVAEKVFNRRGLIFEDTERDILNNVFELTAKFRR